MFHISMDKHLLEKKVHELEIELRRGARVITETQDHLTKVKAEVAEYRRQLYDEDHNTMELQMTDHAMFRFLERHRGLDKVELAHDLLEIIRRVNPTFKDGIFNCGSFEARIENKRVTTII